MRKKDRLNEVWPIFLNPLFWKIVGAIVSAIFAFFAGMWANTNEEDAEAESDAETNYKNNQADPNTNDYGDTWEEHNKKNGKK